MGHSREQPQPQSGFEIQSFTLKTPFNDPAVQGFFSEWCAINDGKIIPVFVPRDQWIQMKELGGKILGEINDDGKQILSLPQDLQLWEMIDVMIAIDKDTFIRDAKQWKKKEKELRHLGTIFKNSGIYIAQRLPYVEEGHEIAEALAQEFYEYGLSLEIGKRSDISTELENIANQNLTPKDNDEVDRFLAGEHLYSSRKARAGVNPETAIKDYTDEEKIQLEQIRRKTLAQFFRVSALAFRLRQRPEDSWKSKTPDPDNPPKPWQSDTPIHDDFIARTRSTLERTITIPESKLVISIFRRGLNHLLHEMPKPEKKKPKLSQSHENRRLKYVLQISKLKKELDNIRKTGDGKLISMMERKITDLIQSAVSSYPYEFESHYPAKIIKDQVINCVGASILGGALMNAVGIRYLVCDLPNHSVLLLITADGSVEWRDMQNPVFNEPLSDEIIIGINQDGTPLTVSDIVAFSQNPNPRGLKFDINPIYDRLMWITRRQRQHMTIYPPTYGQQIQILYHLGAALSNHGRHADALVAYRQAIALNPQSAASHYNIGATLSKFRHYADALVAYRQAIALNPQSDNYYFYMGLTLSKFRHYADALEAFRRAVALNPQSDNYYFYMGLALANLDRNADALEAFRRAVALNPKSTIVYYYIGIISDHLGRYNDALEACQKYIELADINEDSKMIEKIKKYILDLERLIANQN